jgi:hypothetical protein
MKACFKILFFLVVCIRVNAQVQNEAEIIFDFNGHTFNEKHNKVKERANAVTLHDDRFGNEGSAVYLQGNINSYLSLGTSPLLKPKKGTVALWVKLDRDVRSGKGYPFNPIICTKNSTNHGWYNAYHIGLDLTSSRFATVMSIDSVKPEAIAHSIDKVKYGQWYHFVITFDDTLRFYINGELQNKSPVPFDVVYLPGDSVVVGHSASRVNERFSEGTFDDIYIFHRVLNEKEVREIYNAPNPNEFKRILNEILKYFGIAMILVFIILVLVYRYRKKLKQQKERLELDKHIAELEMKVVKTQMNPHFISNCLAAIQELIYSGNIDKAGQYIAKFSLFLRQVLDYSDKTYITLEEELGIIKLNIELEQLRFKENFNFNIDLRSEINAREILIPSLITQPIIENAIWHGLLPLKDRKPWLGINIYSRDGSVFVEIEDNGVGRKREGNGNGKKSMGTKLVKDKLESISKLTESTNYKLEIVDLYSENGTASGTKIIIELDNSPELTT